MSMNPLHQFEVAVLHPLHVAGLDLSITNQAVWTFIAVAAISLLFVAGVANMKLVPGRLQAFVEMTYEFIHNLVKDNTGEEGLKYFPLILTLFLFLAGLNVAGMFPGSFTATSQITTTAFMAVVVFAMVIAIGFKEQGLHFLGLFYPAGTPGYLAPLIVPLELISFFARPLTLAVRLCANMVAGHVLMKIFATFVIMLMGWFALTAVAPFVLLVALSGLELFVALLQAYIFTVLTCVYLNDALHGH
ncbi:MAG: F0F1 ATP synthase subunit A [Alphaproteobacteria bacterium]